ncbi:tripartite tricarboxylate transporter substrate binding protein [Orrella sp. JC864]|uniref:Bug family tripartite tricarboxylate transporter substrate binding protein n=1 Tax=Orrella sp. JC864 TaxID=3120298 RepID=UPI00300B790E
MNIRPFSLALAGVALATAANALAQDGRAAQDYPTRPVKLIVAAATGSSPDAISRQLANALGTKWKQPVVIENAVGLGGIIGAEKAARQPADGYTLVVSTSGAMSVGASLMKLSYDPVKDFEPVALVMFMPNLLVVHPDVPVKNLQELIAYGKQHPNKLRYGHPGIGTTPHLSAELLKDMTGLRMQPIPYKSSAQMATDLLAGHYEVLFHNSSVMLPHVQSGGARPLGVTSAERVATLPEVPTVAQAGDLQGFEVNAWWGVYAPAGTPAELLARLNADIVQALQQPAISGWIREQGGQVGGGTPQDLREHQRQEASRWAALIEKAGIKAQ